MSKSETWDVVVVGSGASGLSAAVMAASPDCRVLVLEKCSTLGGSTALAIGSVTAAGTKLQARAGIQDSVEDFLEDVDRASGNLIERDNRELKRVIVGEIGPTVDWLSDLGASFVGPFHEPPHRVPRMHNIVPNSRSYISVLKQAATRRGVVIRPGSQALELIREDGGVKGVRVRSSDDVLTIMAGRAVILATGDYSSNKKIKAQFMSEDLAEIGGANPDSTGDGHLMAMEIGADVRNMDFAAGPNLRFMPPDRPLWIESVPTFPAFARLLGAVARYAPRNFFRFVAKRFLTVHTAPSVGIFREGAILIDKDGKRFVNELQNTPLAVNVAKQPEKMAYILIDSVLAKKFSGPPNHISTAPGIAYAYFDDYRALRKDIVHAGQTLSQLAQGLRMDPAILEETVNKYNHLVASGKDDDFGRIDLGQGFHKTPYYALGPVMGFYGTVDGGLAVDSKCRVLTTEGKIIPGLYAVGSAGQGGLILPGHGLHIAWALVSGRIAGQDVHDVKTTEI